MVFEKPTLVEVAPGRYKFGEWKINELHDGSFESVRIRPTRFFRAASLDSAVKSIERREAMTNECANCDEPIELIYDFGYQPDCNKLLSSPDESAPTAPLRLCRCTGCGLVQLERVPQMKLFTQDYPFETSVNESYLKLLREWVSGLNWLKDAKILEIACNDGYLLKIFEEQGFKDLSGIEPIERIAELAQKRVKSANIMPQFFDVGLASKMAKYPESSRFEFIIMNNAFAHISNLKGLIQGMSLILAPHGEISIEVQDTEHLSFSNIYHEHLYYYDAHTLFLVMSGHGFYPREIQSLPTHGGSLRMSFKRGVGGVDRTWSRAKEYNWAGWKEKTERFFIRVFNNVQMIKEEGKTIACYGASAKGISTLNYMGLKASDILACADDTASKIGKFMPGSRIPIVSHEEIQRLKPDYLWILNDNYKDQMIEKTYYIKQWGGKHLCLTM